MNFLLLTILLGTLSAVAKDVVTHAHHPGEESCSSIHVSGKEAMDLAETMNSVTEKINVLFRPEFCKALDSCHDVASDTQSDCHSTMIDYDLTKTWLGVKKVGTCGMTPEEVFVVRSYTGGLYDCLNKYLWNPFAQKGERQILVDVLNSGLKKLPAYKGLVRRGVNFPEKVRAQHKKGAVVTYEAFTSSSAAEAFTGRQDQVLMFSASGRPIMGFSTFTNEAEVLFPSKTKFRVLDVMKKGGKNFYVLKEVTTGTKKEQDAEDKKILEIVAKDEDVVGSPDRFVCPLTGEAPKEFIQKTRPENIKDFQIQ